MSIQRFWTILALVSLLPILSVISARAEDTLPRAEEVIVRADALGANRDFDGAVNLLKRAVERYPTYGRLHLALATWQEVRAIFAMSSAASESFNQRREALRTDLRKYPDVTRELFDTYGLAMMTVPDVADIRKEVASLTAKDYPTALGEYGPLALPGSPVVFTYTLSDPQLLLEQRAPQQGLVTTVPLPAPQRADALYAKDPKYGMDARYAKDPKYGNWVFKNMLLAYAYDRKAKRWDLKFRVMWQDVRGREQNRLLMAQQCAHVLLRCSWLLQAYTGLEPRFTQDGAVNVWLAEKGLAGGEAYNENIYLQEVGVTRSGTEWVRELAHEYGHQTFPAVGGYTQPEWGANGLLGERLFMRWLTLNPETKENAPAWIAAMDSHEVRDIRINRLVRHFASLGPEAPQMRDTDAAAMDAFIGMSLHLEMTRGCRLLTAALNQMTTPMYAGPRGFLKSLEEQELYFQNGEQPSITLKLGDLPSDIPLWLYLRDGAWRGKLEGWNDLTLAIKVEVDGKPLILDATGSFTASALKQGWHRIRITPPETTTIPPLVSLTLTRQ